MILIHLVMVAAPNHVMAQEEKCQVAISAPKEGANVGEVGTAEGTAAIPTRGFLWILAHKAGLNGWWPQGDGHADIRSGQWEVSVHYGQARDIGSKFEVAAVVVDRDDNNRLERWVEDAPGKGYPPTTFPNSLAGCPIKKAAVIKTSH